MLNKLNKEQLEKLLLHTVGINCILTEVLLTEQVDEPPVEVDEPKNVNVDIFVIDPEILRGKEKSQDKEPLNLDILCGDWKGGKKRPDLLIFKAAPGYMIALGKKSKNEEVSDCWLIHEHQDNLCFNVGDGYVYLSYDGESDKLNLYPGGEYSRVEEAGK